MTTNFNAAKTSIRGGSITGTTYGVDITDAANTHQAYYELVGCRIEGTTNSVRAQRLSR